MKVTKAAPAAAMKKVGKQVESDLPDEEVGMMLDEGLVKELPTKWSELCQAQQTSTFAWAHYGTKAGNAWVRLRASKQLETKWGKGKWEAEKSDDVLHLIFGGVRHVSKLRKDGKFQVTKRLKESTQKEMEHPQVGGIQCFTAGWPINEAPKAPVKTPPSKRKAPMSDDASEASPNKRARTTSKVEPLDGFNVFLILGHAIATKNRKGLRPNAVWGSVRKCWDDLSDENKALHNQDFKSLRAQYAKANKILKLERESGNSPEAAAKDDAKHAQDQADDVALPKKPVGGAWGVFYQEKRPELLKDPQADRNVAVITKKIKELWDALDENQKQPYQEQYAARKKAYDEAKAEQGTVAAQQQQAAAGGS